MHLIMQPVWKGSVILSINRPWNFALSESTNSSTTEPYRTADLPANTGFFLLDDGANVLESRLYLVIQAIKACLDTKPEVRWKINRTFTHHPAACPFYPAWANIQANNTWVLSNCNSSSSSAEMIWQCKTSLLNNISQQPSYILLYFMLLSFASTSLDHPKGFFSAMFFKYLQIIMSPAQTSFNQVSCISFHLLSLINQSLQPLQHSCCSSLNFFQTTDISQWLRNFQLHAVL